MENTERLKKAHKVFMDYVMRHGVLDHEFEPKGEAADFWLMYKYITGWFNGKPFDITFLSSTINKEPVIMIDKKWSRGSVVLLREILKDYKDLVVTE